MKKWVVIATVLAVTLAASNVLNALLITKLQADMKMLAQAIILEGQGGLDLTRRVQILEETTQYGEPDIWFSVPPYSRQHLDSSRVDLDKALIEAFKQLEVDQHANDSVGI